MKLVVVGGQSRSVGKTSLVASIIGATRELGWTALKITQYGHGVCSTSGGCCACEVEDPSCPYAITRELDGDGRSDTSRFLRAGARDVYWVRTRMGQLGAVIPELRRTIEAREFVIVESNSLLEFFRPDLYLSVLQPDVTDFKASCRAFLGQADAYVVNGKPFSANGRPVFPVEPPAYFSPQILRLVQERLAQTVSA